LEHGSALVTDAAKGQTISIVNELGLELKRVNVGHLQRIMSLRLEEIFQLIAQELEQAGLTDYLRAGVFLCGGGSRVPGIVAARGKCFSDERHASATPRPSAA
jgi:cell division ATPase FtsA